MNFLKLVKMNILGGLILFSTSLFAQKVKVDFDENTDFSKYKTFQFLGWQEDIDQVLSDFDKKRMRDAFKAEMDKRKLAMVESGADMTMSLYIVIDQQTSITGYTNYYNTGAGRGYRRGRGGGWGMGHSTTTYSANDYLQGTMVVDVFDGESKEDVWQAVGVGTVTEKPEKREKSIPKTVKKVMKKFPIEPVK